MGRNANVIYSHEWVQEGVGLWKKITGEDIEWNDMCNKIDDYDFYRQEYDILNIEQDTFFEFMDEEDQPFKLHDSFKVLENKELINEHLNYIDFKYVLLLYLFNKGDDTIYLAGKT